MFGETVDYNAGSNRQFCFHQKMKALFLLLVLPFSLGLAQTKKIESTWIFIPDDSMTFEEPWRIVLYQDSTVLSQRFFFGCKSEFGAGLRMVNGVIEIKGLDKENILIRKEGDRLVCSRKFQDKSYECVFRENAEWNKVFEAAPYPPKNKREALAVLDQILTEKDKKALREMKKEDLITLHHGFGTGLRNGFGLWNPGSQIVKDCGVQHPDDASGKLIEEYWATLQKK